MARASSNSNPTLGARKHFGLRAAIDSKRKLRLMPSQHDRGPFSFSGFDGELAFKVLLLQTGGRAEIGIDGHGERLGLKRAETA